MVVVVVVGGGGGGGGGEGGARGSKIRQVSLARGGLGRERDLFTRC